MKSKLLYTRFLALLGILALMMTPGCSLAGGRPQPADESRSLFQGVTYQRETHQSPQPMVVHIVTIDLRQKGLTFLVTPGDPGAELPLKARTTSRFIEEFELQLAINGDGFTPWESNGPLTSYPRAGDPVVPIGLAASRGVVYAQATDNEPTLYLSKTNKARFNSPDGKVYNAISGNRMIVEHGVAVSGLVGDAEPRTAIGLDRRGRRLILVVVDGRQSGYSEGATLAELARILIEQGAYYGMNLDGGGSSTLAIEGVGGSPTVLNSPIDNNLTGRERPVGNHLGVFAPRNTEKN
jgi:Phosphodiester glycosidase